VNWKPSQQLHFNASYSKQTATDTENNSKIPDAPGQQVKANVNWVPRPQWALNGQLNWVGDRARVAGDLRSAIADYTLLNVTLHRKNILPELDLSLAVRNLANADAREPSSGSIPDDYPLEARSVWLGLTYSIN